MTNKYLNSTMFQIVGHVFYFGISQNIVIFLKLEVTSLQIFLLCSTLFWEHLKREKKIPNRRIIVARSIFIFRYHLNNKFEFESKANSVCIELGVYFLGLILFYLLKKKTQTLMWRLVRGNVLRFPIMFKDSHVWLQITLGN